MDSKLTWKTFPAASYEDWKQSATLLLKGADFDKKLVLKSYDGFSVQPLYTKKDLAEIAPIENLPRAIRYEDKAWRVAQEYDATKWEDNVAAIKRDVAAGVSEVWIKDISTLKNLTHVLDFSKHRVCFLASQSQVKNFEKMVKDFLSVCKDAGVDARKVQGSFNFDPIGMKALNVGDISPSITEELARASLLIKEHCPQMKSITVTGEYYANAGAADAHELAYVVASGIEYLRILMSKGLDLDSALHQISFSLATATDFFSNVAKLRAARILWTQVAQTCGFSSEAILPLWIHVKTAQNVLTIKDPWINLLRGTTSTWAGAIGGADSVTVLPFDYRAGETSEMGRRVSKNTQLILQEECQLSYVEDAAAGSYYLEILTKEIADCAWKKVQQIEASDGMQSYIDGKKVYEEIAAIHKERNTNIRKRKDIVTGVSEFPLLKEEPLVRPPRKSLLDTNAASCALKVNYVAAPFESLREKSDQFLARQGRRPQVIMVTLGPTSQHIARSVFTQNFIEAGGLQVQACEGEKGPAEIKKIMKDHHTDVVVFAAPDAIYEAQGASFVSSLREVGAKTLVVAGRPNDEMKKWGAESFLFMGCDALSVYDQIWKVLE